mmetsp:Transcript_115131/g.289712  ORF Transcript_115131/g.289712 Transcript_115131/m.289712 type:complete len:222 (+) Transcript_115131:241-906(+)
MAKAATWIVMVHLRQRPTSLALARHCADEVFAARLALELAHRFLGLECRQVKGTAVHPRRLHVPQAQRLDQRGLLGEVRGRAALRHHQRDVLVLRARRLRRGEGVVVVAQARRPSRRARPGVVTCKVVRVQGATPFGRRGATTIGRPQVLGVLICQPGPFAHGPRHGLRGVFELSDADQVPLCVSEALEADVENLYMDGAALAILHPDVERTSQGCHPHRR